MKGLSKKDRLKLEEQRQEQARIQAEMEAQIAKEEELRRLEEEKRMNVAKQKREIIEQGLRTDQLTMSTKLIREILKYNWNTVKQNRLDAEVSKKNLNYLFRLIKEYLNKLI